MQAVRGAEFTAQARFDGTRDAAFSFVLGKFLGFGWEFGSPYVVRIAKNFFGGAKGNSQRLFDLLPLERGIKAEKYDLLLPGGRKGLPSNFKTIDQPPATSVTTIDTAAKSYQTASGLRNRIISKAKPLVQYPDGPKMLRVGIPDDVQLSPAQIRAAEQATHRLQRDQIKLVIVPMN